MKRPYKAYIEGLEDGLTLGYGFDVSGVSKRWLQAYKAGVKRGSSWRRHIREDKFGWPEDGESQ